MVKSCFFLGDTLKKGSLEWYRVFSNVLIFFLSEHKKRFIFYAFPKIRVSLGVLHAFNFFEQFRFKVGVFGKVF